MKSNKVIINDLFNRLNRSSKYEYHRSEHIDSILGDKSLIIKKYSVKKVGKGLGAYSFLQFETEQQFKNDGDLIMWLVKEVNNENVN